jgi:hypothetical protein
VEAQQCVKLTSTNRPGDLTTSLSERSPSRLLEAPRWTRETLHTHFQLSLSMIFDLPLNEGDNPPDQRHGFPVPMAQGPHPFPFRTRPLSPAAAMVLRGRLRGRVARCRILDSEPRPEKVGALLFPVTTLGV